jgi:hypothetical protein
MSETMGPLNTDDMRQAVVARRIIDDTPVRHGLDGGWYPASKVKGLIVTSPRATPPPAPPPEASPVFTPVEKPSPFTLVSIRPWPSYVLVGAFVMWCLASNSPQPVGTLCYLAIILFTTAVAAMVWRRSPTLSTSLVVATSGFFAILAIYAFAQIDTYEEHFDEGEIAGNVTYEFWTNQPVREYARIYADDSKADLVVTREGPLSGDPREWHGKWDFTFWDPADIRWESRYYWYGEEVSQGEWQLRNRQWE